jgi:iron-sulfur cluster assembly accessory protein
MSSTVDTPLTPMTAPGGAKPLLTLTDAAVAKVKFFAETMPDSQGKPLRVFVQGGGCSGFQYGFTFDEPKDGDNSWEQGGVQVVVDPQSAIYLKDAVVNYVEDFRGAGFAVENPNASGGCGCGKSFNA